MAKLVIFDQGVLRSDIIRTDIPCDEYEMSVFEAETCRLVHQERHSFMRAAFGISVAGGGIRLQDKLAQRAKRAGREVGNRAELISSLTTLRSGPGWSDEEWRQRSAALRHRVSELFPQTREGRFFGPGVVAEVDVIDYFRQILHGASAQRAILVDPFFGADALVRFGLRLQSTDVPVTIVTSWAGVNPDTGDDETAEKALARLKCTLDGLVGEAVRPPLTVLNIVIGGRRAFHDRYLVLYQHDEATKVYMLSNSVNNMAGAWPFCITRLEPDIARKVQIYVENLVSTGLSGPGSSLATNFVWQARGH